MRCSCSCNRPLSQPPTIGAIEFARGGLSTMTNTELSELTDAPPSLVLRTAADGRLHVHVDGRCVPVRLRQCFPWSEPGLHLSLRDDEDREVAIVDDPALLERESQRALEHALAEAGVG